MTQLHSVASLDIGDGRTCRCRVCECGKHPCPGIRIPFIGETTYQDEYVPKRVERDPRRRGPFSLFPTKAEPGHFKTTNQEAAEQLAGKNVRPSDSYKPRPELPPPIPFEGISTHQADYPGYMPDYCRARPQHKPLPKMKGTYDTTKGNMDECVDDLHKKKQLPKPPKSCKMDDGKHADVPFDGITTYTAEYPEKNVPVSRVKPPSNMDPLDENRNFETTHAHDYKIPPLHIRHLCPAAFIPTRPVSRDGHIKISVYNIPTGDVMV